MATALSFLPPRQEIKAKQGDILGPFTVTFPYDITGYTFAGQVRKTPDAATVAATVSFNITNAAAGQVEWWIEPSEMRALTCHPTDINDATSAYVADLQAIPVDTTRRFTFMALDIKAEHEVTAETITP